MRASLVLATMLAVAVPTGIASAAPYKGKITCKQASNILTNAGYTVFSVAKCKRRVYEFSTLKGEAVLVLFDSRTGKWKDIFGGD